jgi:hypothetical protein
MNVFHFIGLHNPPGKNPKPDKLIFKNLQYFLVLHDMMEVLNNYQGPFHAIYRALKPRGMTRVKTINDSGHPESLAKRNNLNIKVTFP